LRSEGGEDTSASALGNAGGSGGADAEDAERGVEANPSSERTNARPWPPVGGQKQRAGGGEPREDAQPFRPFPKETAAIAKKDKKDKKEKKEKKEKDKKDKEKGKDEEKEKEKEKGSGSVGRRLSGLVKQGSRRLSGKFSSSDHLSGGSEAALGGEGNQSPPAQREPRLRIQLASISDGPTPAAAVGPSPSADREELWPGSRIASPGSRETTASSEVERPDPRRLSASAGTSPPHLARKPPSGVPDVPGDVSRPSHSPSPSPPRDYESFLEMLRGVTPTAEAQQMYGIDKTEEEIKLMDDLSAGIYMGFGGTCLEHGKILHALWLVWEGLQHGGAPPSVPSASTVGRLEHQLEIRRRESSHLADVVREKEERLKEKDATIRALGRHAEGLEAGRKHLECQIELLAEELHVARERCAALEHMLKVQTESPSSPAGGYAVRGYTLEGSVLYVESARRGLSTPGGGGADRDDFKKIMRLARVSNALRSGSGSRNPK
jgi:hypothetical protein